MNVLIVIGLVIVSLISFGGLLLVAAIIDADKHPEDTDEV
jgi:hypothetical protein